VTQGRNLGDAAAAAHVPLVVFSGGERIGVDAMDNKIKIEEYLRGLPWAESKAKLVVLHTAFFYENVATKRGTRRVKVRCGEVRCMLLWRGGMGGAETPPGLVIHRDAHFSNRADWALSDCTGGGGPCHGRPRCLPLLHPPPQVRVRACLMMMKRAQTRPADRPLHPATCLSQHQNNRDMKIPFVSPTDIGRFAAAVMLHPDRFKHGNVKRAISFYIHTCAWPLFQHQCPS
jgi:hypothetical protein